MWGFGMGVGKGCTVNKSFERLDLGLEKVGEGRGGEGEKGLFCVEMLWGVGEDL